MKYLGFLFLENVALRQANVVVLKVWSKTTVTVHNLGGLGTNIKHSTRHGVTKSLQTWVDRGGGVR